MIDHINHNPCDNRLVNVRWVSSQENAQNRKKRANTTSKFIGVSKRQRSKKRWRAKCAGTDLGCFWRETNAAHAYNTHVKKMFPGGFPLNDIDVPQDNDEPTQDDLNAYRERVRKKRKTDEYSSIYFGVAKTTTGKWSATVRNRTLGTFAHELYAAAIHDNYITTYFPNANLMLNNITVANMSDVRAHVNQLGPPKETMGKRIMKKVKTVTFVENGPVGTIYERAKRFVSRLCYEGKSFTKTHNTLGEAEAYLHELFQVHYKTPVSLKDDKGQALLRSYQGVNILVDDDIASKFIGQFVAINSDGYPMICIEGVQRLLHRIVMHADERTTINHINNDKLDARRQNLRVVTPSLNAYYAQRKSETASSKYRYVSYRAKRKKFRVVVTKECIKTRRRLLSKGERCSSSGKQTSSGTLWQGRFA